MKKLSLIVFLVCGVLFCSISLQADVIKGKIYNISTASNSKSAKIILSTVDVFQASGASINNCIVTQSNPVAANDANTGDFYVFILEDGDGYKESLANAMLAASLNNYVEMSVTVDMPNCKALTISSGYKIK